MKSRKILFINHTGAMAGGETVFVDVIRSVAEDSDNELYVICAADGNTQFREALSNLSLKDFKRLPYRVLRNTSILALRNFIFSILSIIYLIFYSLYHKIDIIYSNTSVNVIGIIVARILRKKHIWHIHELSTVNYRWTPPCLDRIYKGWFLYHKNYSVFVSETTKLAWQKQISSNIERSEVLYSKYKEVKIEKSSHSHFTFGFLGSLTASKNVDVLINAFTKITGAHLLIGGDGPKLESLKLQANETNRNEDIKFLGHVTNLSEFYSSIDVLVQVSLNESWGLVTLEAIGAGRSVIMTRETGLKEILDDEQGCIFVDPEDVESIFHAMKKVMDDNSYRETIVSRGQRILKEININNLFDNRIKQILRDVYDFSLYTYL